MAIALYRNSSGMERSRAPDRLGLPLCDREAQGTTAVIFDKVSFAFDDHVVLREISFSIPAGSMRILLGASGTGKSIVLKLILGLLRPDSGTIVVNGKSIGDMSERDLMRARADIGMLFHESALFDSLTVAENVGIDCMRKPICRTIRCAGVSKRFWTSSE